MQMSTSGFPPKPLLQVYHCLAAGSGQAHDLLFEGDGKAKTVVNGMILEGQYKVASPQQIIVSFPGSPAMVLSPSTKMREHALTLSGVGVHCWATGITQEPSAWIAFKCDPVRFGGGMRFLETEVRLHACGYILFKQWRTKSLTSARSSATTLTGVWMRSGSEFWAFFGQNASLLTGAFNGNTLFLTIAGQLTRSVAYSSHGLQTIAELLRMMDGVMAQAQWAGSNFQGLEKLNASSVPQQQSQTVTAQAVFPGFQHGSMQRPDVQTKSSAILNEANAECPNCRRPLHLPASHSQ